MRGATQREGEGKRGYIDITTLPKRKMEGERELGREGKGREHERERAEKVAEREEEGRGKTERAGECKQEIVRECGAGGRQRV